jgi:23S rRNA (uracil1939-C5)-methyltransferase
MGRKNKIVHLEDIEITGIAAEGNAVAKPEGQVIFVPYAAIGDVVDLRYKKTNKSFQKGQVTQRQKAR